MSAESSSQNPESSDITDVHPHPHASTLSPIASEPGSSDAAGSEETLHVEQQPAAAEPSIHARSSTATDDADARSRTTQRPTLPTRDSRSTIVLEGWVDDEYCNENPWYGQARKKPVFSLARPLPHTTRRAVRTSRGDIENQEGSVNDSRADLVSTQGLSRNVSNTTEQRMTTSGAAHSTRQNDAGQPVFTYLPGAIVRGGNKYDTINRCELKDTNHDPRYGIDSEPLGKRDNDEVEEGRKDPDELRNWWARIRARHPEPLAEFLATGVAIFLGLCATLSVNLTADHDQGGPYGTYETTCWAWGFAWMFGIYLGGGISGAHMNPVISISLAIFRGFPWRSCLIYVVLQFLAAITAGGLAWVVFKDTIRSVDPTLEKTSKCFFSTPQEQVSPGNAFLNQFVGAAIMVITVFALGDDQNNPPGAGMHAFVLGLLVTMLRFSLGYNIGSGPNPAADFGPRVIAYAIGYRQHNVFKSMWWFYGPWVATLTGSLVGCSIYDGLIFVGSESPVNYRIPEKLRRRTRGILHGLVGGRKQ